MKTAEEWDKFFSERYNRKTAPEFAAMSQFDFFKDMCSHIQLDAFRAGMERAAGIVDERADMASIFVVRNRVRDCANAILTAAKELKEIPQ